MGNSQGAALQDSSGSSSYRTEKRYKLSEGKVGYAVLLGNELGPERDETVGQRLGAIEEAFRSPLHLDTMTPFLTHGKNELPDRVAFSRNEFERIRLMHSDRDMLNSLAGYCSFLLYYCGRGNEEGVVTKDNLCLKYSYIIKSVCDHSCASGKPTVFVFDCIFDQGHTLNIDAIVKRLRSELVSLPENLLICLTCQSDCIDSPGVFTNELAQIIHDFPHFLSLTDLLTIAGLRAKLVLNGSTFHGPVLFNTLTAQLVLATDTSLPLISDVHTWANYCSSIIKKQGSFPLPFPDAFPGCGRRIFLLYASDVSGHVFEYSPVYPLAKWLNSLGYEVYCDCSLGDRSGEGEWLSWYSAHLMACKNIVLVCSPEMGGAIQSTTPPTASFGWAASLISAICQKLGREDRHFFPVSLSPRHSPDWVPAIFAGGKSYRLVGPPPGPGDFDPKQIRSDYDELVFHISRLPLPAPPQLGRVQSLPNEKAPSNIVITREVIESLYRPEKGYVQVSKPIPNAPVHFTVPPYTVASANQPQPPGIMPPHQNPQTVPLSYHHSPIVPRLLVYQRPANRAVILWLAERLIEWKFMGRRLGLEEYQLTRIERENPNTIREQAIQMLYTWQQQNAPTDTTHERLLDGLKFAENAQLCKEFVEYVNQQDIIGDADL